MRLLSGEMSWWIAEMEVKFQKIRDYGIYLGMGLLASEQNRRLSLRL